MSAFTTQQLAHALSVSGAGVRKTLTRAGIRPSTALIIEGRAVDAWAVEALPGNMREQLSTIAGRNGYSTIEGLLGMRAWEPKIPFNEVSQAARDKAVKLRQALGPSLARLGADLSRDEFERLGLDDCKRAGLDFSARHFRRLIARTEQRAGGAQNFERDEIFLDEAPARQKPPPASAAAHAAFADDVAAVICTFKNQKAPSVEEVAYLWVRAFEMFESAIADGKPARKTKRLLCEALFERATFLAATLAALRKNFDRKLQRWIAGDRRLAAVKDQRPAHSGKRAPALSQDDQDQLSGHAVLFCGGRVSQAWRELRQSNKLSEDLIGRFQADPASKSYVPHRIRDAVQCEVDAMKDIHHGPRRAKLKGAYISRDWSGVAAGDWYQGDDVTLPVYYYEPDGKGWFTLWRGQCLIMVDLRSQRILGYVLLSSKNYNSLAIRTLITRVADEHGLPRKGFYFERGIWKISKILTGSASKDAPLSNAEVEGGLGDLGLRFVHAKLPRAKPIEGTIGAVQNLMEGQLGYCGRNEQTEVFEHVKKAKALVESRKLHPSRAFLSADEWEQKLKEIFGAYNAARQDGKMTGGLSPDAAFAQYQKAGDPQSRFDASCRYLLAHNKSEEKVTSNGITLSYGPRFVYRNEETGKRIGQRVLAWFNPETPEILCVTDLRRQNAFVVERAPDVPAMDAPSEVLKQALRQADAHNAPIKERYAVLKSKFAPRFRPNLASPETVELGREMEQQTAAALARKQEETKAARAIERVAARAGVIPSPEVASRAGLGDAIQERERLLAELSEQK